MATHVLNCSEMDDAIITRSPKWMEFVGVRISVVLLLHPCSESWNGYISGHIPSCKVNKDTLPGPCLCSYWWFFENYLLMAKSQSLIDFLQFPVIYQKLNHISNHFLTFKCRGCNLQSLFNSVLWRDHIRFVWNPSTFLKMRRIKVFTGRNLDSFYVHKNWIKSETQSNDTFLNKALTL